jgi:hypothetical protein
LTPPPRRIDGFEASCRRVKAVYLRVGIESAKEVFWLDRKE